MRILHTGDWHLGRVFQQVNLLDDQALVLEQIFEYVLRYAPHVLIIAGDVFDRASPSREAIDLFDRFLSRVYQDTDTAIVVIAGNHDAPERIGYGGLLHDTRRVQIRGPLDRGMAPLILNDEAGPVAISALPFAGPFAARAYYGNDELRIPEDVIRLQMEEARSQIPQGARWIVTAHGFVQGGTCSESEKSLEMIGGLETIPSNVFDGVHYVALGHLHRAQAVGVPHIRYAGSILRYGFDEVDVEKSVTLAELQKDGSVRVENLPLISPRTLRVVEGLFDDILGNGSQGNFEDFIKIRLLDTGPIHDVMNRIRTVYPHTVQIEWANREAINPVTGTPVERARTRHPVDLFATFFEDVTGSKFEASQRQTIAAVTEVVIKEGD